MGVPSNYRKNLNILPSKIGNEEREVLYKKISDEQPNLPSGIYVDDLDSGFVDFVNKDLELVIDGKKIPVIFLTLQRFSEFSKTWQFTGEYKDIEMPFITIVRNPDIQPGTNQSKNWNTADHKLYSYIKVPTWDGSRKGIDVYKIPQPTAIDLIYDVSFFSNKMRDTNKFQTQIQKLFNSRQFYIFPKGFPMPVVLEDVSDESNISDFESRRFYLQKFNMKLMGYILDEADFTVTPMINRVMVMTEVLDKKYNPLIRINTNKDTSLITLDLVFIKNLVTAPFIGKVGDILTFNIIKLNNNEARFQLSGNLL